MNESMPSRVQPVQAAQKPVICARDSVELAVMALSWRAIWRSRRAYCIHYANAEHKLPFREPAARPTKLAGPDRRVAAAGDHRGAVGAGGVAPAGAPGAAFL